MEVENMNWELLLLLVCPLMMLFCMKGMFGGHNHKKSNENVLTNTSHYKDMQAMKVQMEELAKQNQQLSEELQALRDVK